jgi:prepilin-type N-terminal cleavage/methylation domain-containing protein
MQAGGYQTYHTKRSDFSGFTLIELLIVIAIIAILAVVVVLTLNPAELLRQSRDANRVSDMATLTSALNLYTTDQTGASSFSLGSTASTGISIYDPNASSICGSLGLPSLGSSTWYCGTATSSRSVGGQGWIPVSFSNISAGSPIGSLPVDPVNQTSSGLFYSYNTNGTQFEVTANLESQKYKTQYGNNSQTSYFPEVISGGTPTVSALYNPSGLVGYWPMNEGTGSSTLDQSGNGNAGTWIGSAAGNNGTYYTGGKVGNYAGDFNGSNDDVVISPTSVALQALSNAGSISAWISYSILSGADRAILDLGGTGSHGLVLWASAGSNNTPGLQYGNGTAATIVYASSPLSVGTWYLITTTWTSNGANIYVNGILNTSTSTAPSITTYSSTAYIGSNNGTLRYAEGGLDEIRVYSRALSPAEVMALYNAEK